ncbi:MAG: AMIN domain-containing protein [Sulfurimonas sp.]|nr:MAG: AMIN domain-containing protein [Sulfurimonas sp.]
MKYILLSFFVLISLLPARENPFFPSEGMKDLPVSSNLISKRSPLERAAITLPDSARILKEVTLKYQNLDGSIEHQSIMLDHTIDWHIPVFISQSYGTDTSASTARPSKARGTFTPITPFLSYRIYGKSVEFRTQDKVIRDFVLVNPHRVVIDFKRNTDAKSRILPLKQAPFTGIKYGNHGSFYRAVVVLDGKYRCRVVKQKGVVRISLH